MNMQMSSANGIFSVPSEHVPGLIALMAFPLVVWLAIRAVSWLAHHRVRWAETLDERMRSLSTPARVSLFAVGVGAVVHLALVPTHWGDERLIATLFIVDAVGFLAAAVWTFAGWRSWRPASVLMLAGTAAFYAFYLLTGRETGDAVGVLTTAVELTGALILLAPARAAKTVGRQRWSLAASALVALVSLVAVTAIANVSTADTVGAATPAGHATSNDTGAMPGMGNASDSTKLSLATNSPAGAIAWPDSMASMAPGMAMVTPDCAAPPTAAQQKAAVNLVNQTTAAAAPYKSLAAAKAAGYVPITRTGQTVVHYINYSIARQASPLDPNAIPVLVYVNTQHGAVLSAAMFLSTGASAQNPPQPGGCLTQWHTHSDLCFSGGSVVGNNTQGACAAGSTNQATKPMMHIWMTPVSGGPLAPDPSGVSQVAAAAQLPALATPNGVA